MTALHTMDIYNDVCMGLWGLSIIEGTTRDEYVRL